MPEFKLRDAAIADLEPASALCLKSKAHWGYGADFIERCREELTLLPADLTQTRVKLAIQDGWIIGVAQLSSETDAVELDKLFVATELVGQGVGKLLLDWACTAANETGATELRVTADPFAAPFYERMGFRRIGEEPSASIPGRTLGVYRITL